MVPAQPFQHVMLGWAPKRALKVLPSVGNCWRNFRLVRLNRAGQCAKLFGSAALREVTAAEWFRRVLELSQPLCDSDPRLHVLMRVHQGVSKEGTATVSETVSKPATL